MMLGREQAWDTLPNVDVAPDGSFVFEGVPKESVSISPRLKGFRLSLQNPSLDRLNGFSIVGRVEGNIDDLVILFKPGEFRPDHNNPGPDPQPTTNRSGPLERRNRGASSSRRQPFNRTIRSSRKARLAMCATAAAKTPASAGALGFRRARMASSQSVR